MPAGRLNVRLVFDTNVVISGLLWRGPPRTLLESAMTRQIDVYSCWELIAELRATIQRPKFSKKIRATGLSAQQLCDSYLAITKIVKITPLPIQISRDPADDIVLACATAAKADAVVSGDNDLLAIRAYQNIPIMKSIEVLHSLAVVPRTP